MVQNQKGSGIDRPDGSKGIEAFNCGPGKTFFLDFVLHVACGHVDCQSYDTSKANITVSFQGW